MVDNKKLLINIFVSNFILFVGFSVWRSTFNNFAVEELGITALKIGGIQSIRELPGLIGVGVGLIALFMKEMKILALSMIFLGAGIIYTAFTFNYLNLILATLVMSLGFHYFMVSNTSLILGNFPEKNSGTIMARCSSIRSFSAVFSAGIVFLLIDYTGYRNMFLIIGGIISLIGFYNLIFGRAGGKIRKTGFKLRKKYSLFYLLKFFSGCRRHIFTTFAIYLLVREFGVSVKTIAVLFVINSTVRIFANWYVVGWIIDNFGEKITLSVDYSLLPFIFLGYAFIENVYILYILFILDGFLFSFDISISTFLQKIARKSDITSNISIGLSINHIAAVVIPLVGGIIWKSFNYRFTFLAGVVIVVTSIILSLLIETPDRENESSRLEYGG